MKHFLSITLITSLITLTSASSSAGIISLQNGTATYSQTCNGTYNPDAAIDGDLSTRWAIAEHCSSSTATNAQTVVWETIEDFSADQLNISLMYTTGSKHILGNFRLSVTSDDRSTFADGLAIGGDVTANWFALDPYSISSTSGSIFTVANDLSILVIDEPGSAATYDLEFKGNFTNITGIRLEALESDDLPHDGPGLQPTNGNFHLHEIVVQSSGIANVPEPGQTGLISSDS